MEMTIEMVNRLVETQERRLIATLKELVLAEAKAGELATYLTAATERIAELNRSVEELPALRTELSELRMQIETERMRAEDERSSHDAAYENLRTEHQRLLKRFGDEMLDQSAKNRELQDRVQLLTEELHAGVERSVPNQILVDGREFMPFIGGGTQWPVPIVDTGPRTADVWLEGTTTISPEPAAT